LINKLIFIINIEEIVKKKKKKALIEWCLTPTLFQQYCGVKSLRKKESD